MQIISSFVGVIFSSHLNVVVDGRGNGARTTARGVRDGTYEHRRDERLRCSYHRNFRARTSKLFILSALEYIGLHELFHKFPLSGVLTLNRCRCRFMVYFQTRMGLCLRRLG